MTRRNLIELRDVALMHARRFRALGDVDSARERLCLAYWCRGKLRQVAPRPWKREKVNCEQLQGVGAC